MTNKELAIIVRNIESLLNRENRHDRLKALSRENELMRGYIERLEDKMKALEDYLGIHYIKDAKYKPK